MPPLVSVLMPIYNLAEFLPQAIESVLAQDMSDFEFVISDDASTDSSGEIAQQYAHRDRRIRYFRNQKNVGCHANQNLGLRRADTGSRYFSQLASDDWWDPTFLGKLLKIAVDHAEVTVVHCDAYRTNMQGVVMNRYSDLWSHLPPSGNHHAIQALYAGCYINDQAYMINRDRLAEIYPTNDPYDAMLIYAADYHLWLQLLTRGATAYYLPEPLLYYRKHEKALTTDANDVNRLREEVVIFRDKLRTVCPPDLEPARRDALIIRLKQLGFELLRLGCINEAKIALKEAQILSVQPQLDLAFANFISMIPISTPVRKRIWNLAISTSQLLRRLR